LSVSGQRVVTDGGGSAGAIRATSASAEVRKDFTSRWSASLRYTYSDGWVLEGPANAANSNITLEQGGLIVERRFTKNLSFRAQYARIQQMSAGTPAPLTTGNHNRVGVELVYQFTRPLGR
jgi:predicted porin